MIIQYNLLYNTQARQDRLTLWFERPGNPPHDDEVATLLETYYGLEGAFAVDRENRDWTVKILNFGQPHAEAFIHFPSYGDPDPISGVRRFTEKWDVFNDVEWKESPQTGGRWYSHSINNFF